jgi:hypothetical protein
MQRGVRGCVQKPSPTRLLEMLSDRFGAFEAIAISSIKLAALRLYRSDLPISCGEKYRCDCSALGK